MSFNDLKKHFGQQGSESPEQAAGDDEKAAVENNLQPLDFSGRDYDGAVVNQAPVVLPVVGEAPHDGAGEPSDDAVAASNKAHGEEEGSVNKPAAAKDIEKTSGALAAGAAASAMSLAAQQTQAAEKSASETGEHIDLDKILAASTSQLIAVAVENSAASKGKHADPFEPGQAPVADELAEQVEEPVGKHSLEHSSEEPEAYGGIAASEPVMGETALMPELPEKDEVARDTATKEEFEQGETPQADAADSANVEDPSAQYSRSNATYTHRTGWRSFSALKRGVIIAAIVIVAALAAIGGAALAMWQNTADAVKLEDDTIEESLTPTVAQDPYWMLILGSDSRSEKTDRARSDVLMLARIDPGTPRVTLVSIPRDTKVVIEGYGTQKINAAYALGGAKLAIKTVQSYAGVKISHYAEIYFSGLEDLVDKLGGVTVDVPEYCSYSDVTLKPGVQNLTGHEALIFARCRKTYTQGDFTRTQCQRILVTALAEKVLAQDPTKLPDVVAKAAKCFSTDIPLDELVSLATSMQGMSKKNFYSGMAPSGTGMVNGVSYTFTKINQWKLIMQRADNGEKPKLDKKEQAICGEETTAYTELDMEKGLPTDVKSELKSYWKQKEEDAAKKQAKKLKAQQKASEGADGETSAEATSSNGQ